MRWFTQDNGDGTYSVVLTDDQGNFWEFARSSDLNYIQNEHNRLVAGGTPPPPGTPPPGPTTPPPTGTPPPGPLDPGGGYNWATLKARQDYDAQYLKYLNDQLAQIRYLDERRRLLDETNAKNLDERERHRIALEYSAKMSELSGYILDVNDLEAQLAPLTGFGGTGRSNEDMINIRQQLAGEGWTGGDDWKALRDFLAKPRPGQDELVGRLNNPFAQKYEAMGASLLGKAPTLGREQMEFGRELGETGIMANPRTAEQFGMQASALTPTGAPLGAPTLARQDWEAKRQQTLADLAANPRNMVQSLLMSGLSPQAAAQKIGQLPLMRQLEAPAGAGGANPLFRFIGGRQLPVRQTLDWTETQSQNIPTIGGLASFSGQDPNAFFGEFQSYLPKGGRNPLTRFI